MNRSPDIGKVALLGPCSSPSAFIPHLAEALRARHPATQVVLIGLSDGPRASPITSSARPQLVLDDRSCYPALGRWLNKGDRGFDVVSLHYHRGLYGGKDGIFLHHLLDELTIPVVLTVHDIPSHLTRHFASALMGIMERSERIVVGNESGHRSVVATLGVPADRVELIPAPGSSGGAFYAQVSRQTADHESAPGARSSIHPIMSNWSDVAELYNHNFTKAIIDAAPRKRSRRIPPWPWAQSREFNVGSGCTPGWREG